MSANVNTAASAPQANNIPTIDEAIATINADNTLSSEEKGALKLQAAQRINELQSQSKPAAPAVNQPSDGWPEPPKPAAQQGSMDIGPTLGGFAQGLGHGLTGHIYNPHLTPEEQGAANAGTWLGDLGADVGVGLGGAATGAALGSVVPVIGTGLGAAIGAGLAIGGKHLLSNTQDQIHEHPDRPINWGAAGSDALINGAMGAIVPGEGSLIKKILLDSAIGGVGGAGLEASDQYFNNNGHVDAGQVLGAAGGGALAGAALPLGMKGAGKLLGSAGRLFHPTEAPVRLGDIPENTVPTESVGQSEPSNSAARIVKDPVTGQMRIEKPATAIETSSANEPADQGKTLTGHVTYQEPRQADTNAPWDAAEPEEKLNPITGQPTPSQNITAQIEAIRQRQAQEAAAREQQKQALLQRIQQQGQQMEGNQASANPSPENVQQAQSAVEQLQARRQALLQQQQEQAVQQKADELHTLLSNYEKAGLKPNANKLKAQIAENAVKHPDPIEKAASQRALEKYAPSQKYPEGTTHTDAKGNPVKLVEQDSPEQGMSIVQDQNGSYYWTKNEELSPVEGYTPKPSAKPAPSTPEAEPVKVSVKQPETKPEQPLEAQVTKTGESANEPKGQIQQPEGQQGTLTTKENSDTLVKEGNLQGYAEYDNTTPSGEALSSPGLQEPLGQLPDRTKPGRTESSAGEAESRQEPIKKSDIEEGLDTLYPRKQSVEDDFQKEESTRQPEHLLIRGKAQAANWKPIQEMIQDPKFQELRAQLPETARQALDEAIKAAQQGKKLLGRLYNTVTDTPAGKLEKESSYDVEVYSPKAFGYSKEITNNAGEVVKPSQIYMEGYNEQGTLSKRRFVNDEGKPTFSGRVKVIEDAGYQGAVRHPADITAQSMHQPENTIADRINNLFIKKHRQGQEITNGDYEQAASLMNDLLDEAIKRDPAREDEIIDGVFEKIPQELQDKIQGHC